MAQAHSGRKTNSKLACLLLGEVGSNKSETALGLSRLINSDGKQFRILYIDIENGSIDDRFDRWERDYKIDPTNVYIVNTQSMTEVLEYIDKAKKNEDFYELDEEGNETDVIVLDGEDLPFRADAIVVDGIQLLTDSTKMALLETAKLRTDVRIVDKGVTGKKAKVLKGNVKLEPTDYMIVNTEGIKLILSLVGSGKHFVVTSFAKNEAFDDENGEKDGFGNIKKIKTGRLLPDAFKGCEKYVKTVLCLSKDEFNNPVAFVQDKDRTETFLPNSNISDFNMTMFQHIVDKSKNSIVIKNNYEKDIIKQAEKNIMEDSAPKTLEAESTSNSVDTLRAEISSLLGNDVATRKANVGILRNKGLTKDPKKETDIELLKQYVEALKGQ